MIASRLVALLFAALLPFTAAADPVGLPWTQDFEQNSGGFIPSSATAWKWGTPSVGPGTARSGTQVWGTNLVDPNYSAGGDSELRSPEIDLTAAGGKWVILHWWQWLVTEGGFDQGLVEVSKNGGGTWETVFGPRSGVVNNTWTEQTVLLDPSYATANFVIRFRLVADAVGSQGGFFVDDLRITAATLNSVVPLQDFESSDGGYVATGTNSSWAYGEPVSAPGGANSGIGAWATNLDGFYNANEQSALTSPLLDASAAAGKQLVLTWRQFFLTEKGYDFGYVEVSADGGTTWAPAPLDEALTGAISADGWMRRHAVVDASYATAAFRFRFRLVSDDSYQFDGMAIDDVEVFASSSLTPAAAAFTKATFQNVSVAFSRAEFAANYVDNDGQELKSIAVVQLPTNGVLSLGGNAVAAGQVIPANVLSDLTYTPGTNFVGTDSFLWQSSNFFGASNTATVTLDVAAPTPQIAILQEPRTQTTNPGLPVSFSVQAVSSLPLTYEWRKNNEPVLNGNAATLAFNSPTEADEGDYRVVITNAEETVNSVTVRLNVNDPVVFEQQPVSTMVFEDADLTLSVAATGTGRLDYQWLKDNEPITGATFASYTIDDAEAEDGGIYQCRVTNIVGPRTTDPATIAIGLKPRVVTAPVPRGVIVNGSVIFTVEASGLGPFTYQWLRNGIEIPGATSNTLTLTQLQISSQGDYSVRITNSVSHVESEPAELKVFRWADVIGVYQDVLETKLPADPGVSAFPGRLTVKLANGGATTGVLEYRGLTYRFKGVINSELNLVRDVPRLKQSPFTVRLTLDPGSRSLRAVLTHDDNGVAFRSEAVLPQHRYHATKNPAPQLGRYTVLLEPMDGTQGPDAPGWLTATVSTAGAVRLLGALPDGQVIATTANVQTTGRVAIFRKLYAGKPEFFGELCGRVTLPGTPNNSVVSGEFAWRRPPQLPTNPIPTGFLAELEAVGSRYVAPTPQQPWLILPLNTDLLNLEISGPLPGSPLTRWIQLVLGRQFLPVPATGENIKFAVVAADGRVTGSITDPTTKKTYLLKGVLLQAQVAIGGYLVNPAAPGAFFLSPVP
jgi:hypothetical protein